MVNYTIHYPEAFADAFIFSRVDIPDEIVPDQGTSFMSEWMKQLSRNLNISKLRSSPCHPETNGFGEGFCINNRTHEINESHMSNGQPECSRGKH